MKTPTILQLMAAATLVASGCVVSPQPLPPIVPEIDVSRLVITPSTTTLQIHGEPGAVTAGATFQALAATATSQAAKVVVADDGSFDVSLDLDPADIYRLEAELDGAFSDPIDITLSLATLDMQKAAEADRAYAGCLGVDSYPVIDLGPSAIGDSESFAVQLENGCTEDLSIDELRLRDGGQSFFLDSTAPLDIPAGQVRAISLRFEPTATAVSEDLVVVHLGGSVPGFILVTVRGTGIP